MLVLIPVYKDDSVTSETLTAGRRRKSLLLSQPPAFAKREKKRHGRQS